MPIPTIKGQYRKVEYTDDGCSNYQCLWCLNTMEIRDNPRYWNFCPKCGRSWFTKLECREHWQPRWFYDRWGEYSDHDVMVMTTAGEVWANDLPYYFHLEPTLEWYFEVRSDCFDGKWSEWKNDYKYQYDFKHGHKFAKNLLEKFRLDHGDGPRIGWKWEHRVTLRKIT